MNASTRLFLVAGLLVVSGLALFVSPLASSKPDGLNRVAAEKSFDGTARDHDLSDSPVAGYEAKGIDNQWWSKALSGLMGVLITFGVGVGLFALVRLARGKPQVQKRPPQP